MSDPNHSLSVALPVTNSCLLSGITGGTSHYERVRWVVQIPEPHSHVGTTSQQECVTVCHANVHTVDGMGTFLQELFNLLSLYQWQWCGKSQGIKKFPKIFIVDRLLKNIISSKLCELLHEKSCFLHMPKQRCRIAAQ